MNRGAGVILIAVGIILLLLTFTSNGGYVSSWFSFGTEQVDLEKSAEASGMVHLAINTASTDIALKRGSDDRVHVRLQGEVRSSDAGKTELIVEPQGNKLSVGVERPRGSGTWGFYKPNDLTLIVELPEKQWETIKISAGSGDVSAEALDGKSVTAEVMSGDIDLTGVKAADLNAAAASGDVTVTGLTADIANLETKSGDIEAHRYSAGRLTVHAVSGDISLTDGEAALHGETSSGNISVDADHLVHDTALNVSSGDVTVKLANRPQSLAVDFEGGSGEAEIEWDGMTVQEKNEEKSRMKGTFGPGEVKLTVQTGAGDFSLER